MGYQTGIADALTNAGLDVVEYRGWESRGSSSFSPRGLVVHHTGPWTSIDGMVKLCINGYSGLPGPLCHVVLDPHGTCHVIAAGRANHAGSGGWKGLTGNSSVFGIEAIHNGSRATPWPPAQVDAYVVASGALAKMAGFGADMVCGHKEWAPTRKIDPVTLIMADFRLRVDEWLHPPQTPKEGIVAVNRPPIKVLTHLTWGAGYIIVTDDGGVFGFGNAPFFGSTGGIALNRPIVDAEVTPSGQGYILMGADGGMFMFGDAQYAGRVEYRG